MVQANACYLESALSAPPSRSTNAFAEGRPSLCSVEIRGRHVSPLPHICFRKISHLLGTREPRDCWCTVDDQHGATCIEVYAERWLERSRTPVVWRVLPATGGFHSALHKLICTTKLRENLLNGKTGVRSAVTARTTCPKFGNG